MPIEDGSDSDFVPSKLLGDLLKGELFLGFCFEESVSLNGETIFECCLEDVTWRRAMSFRGSLTSMVEILVEAILLWVLVIKLVGRWRDIIV